MDIKKAENAAKHTAGKTFMLVRQLLFGALVISAVGIAAFLLLLLMMYFI